MERIDQGTGEVTDVPMVEIECSAQVEKIFEALAKAQGEIESASTAGQNEAFKRGGKASRYATLDNIVEASRGPLTKNGIATIQVPYNAGTDIGVCTILGHASGQWMKGKLAVKPREFTAHGAGSVITYLRRYLLAAMVGVAPEDDDGNAASIGAPSQAAQRPAGAQKAAAPSQVGAATNGVQAPAADDGKAEAEAIYKSLRAGIAEAPHTTALDSLIEQFTRDGRIGKLRAYGEKYYESVMTSVVKRKSMLEPEVEEIPA